MLHSISCSSVPQTKVLLVYDCLEFQTLHTRPGTSSNVCTNFSLEFGELTFLSKLFRMSLRKEGGV